jgi:hypothetical protein
VRENNCKNSKTLGSLRSPREIQGFFASLRMTNKGKYKSQDNCIARTTTTATTDSSASLRNDNKRASNDKKQIPFGDDKKEGQLQQHVFWSAMSCEMF